MMERVDQSSQKAPFAFDLRSTVTALTASQPRVEQIPHGVAEHVETENDHRQAKPRQESQRWRHFHESTPFPAEHTAPAGNLDGQTKSEEAQRSLSDNHPPDVDREDDDDRCHDIGQHMAGQDLTRGGAHSPGGQKIVILFDAVHRASHDSGAADILL